MPQGIQVWNAAGLLVFDSSVYTVRFAGVQTFTADTGSTIINFTPGTGRTLFFYAVQAGEISFTYVNYYTSTQIEVILSGMQPGSSLNVFYGDKI